jgi:hypothetical protein
MIIQLLQELGFAEGVDFSFENGELVALEKSRDVEQIIQHEEIPAVMDGEVEVTPAVPAWTETVVVPEAYFEVLPALDELKRTLVLRNDPAFLIGEFLKDKSVSENDSLNVDLFLSGNSSGWRFENIPAPSIDELYASIPSTKAAINQQAINAEARAYLASTDWMIVRFAETGVAVPQSVLDARAAARVSIV